MRRQLLAALFVAAIAPLSAGAAATPKPAPSPAEKYPEIYRTTVHPVCSALRTKIGPSVAMLQQNDETIAKGPAQFKAFSDGLFNNSDSVQNLALLRLENLVSPLANNVIAIQKLLSDPNVFPDVPKNDDDRRKLELKAKLLQSLAHQQASLDIINGFVETQNLASMQHDTYGLGYINEISKPNTSSNGKTSVQGPGNVTNNPGIFSATPDPSKPQPFDATLLNAGLETNPYEIDLTHIPGLSLGYNPVSKLREGLEYTQTQNKKAEASLSKAIVDTVALCRDQPGAPSPSPKP